MEEAKNMFMNGTTEEPESHHRELCDAEQDAEMNCIHGTCYRPTLQKDRPFCSCEDGWTGPRCASEDIGENPFLTFGNTDPSGHASTKQIILVAVTAVTFLAILVFTIYLVRRYRRNAHGNQSNLIKNEQKASNESLPQKPPPPNNNNNNHNSKNNNSVIIAIEPTPLDIVLNASQAKEVMSRSPIYVAGRSTRRERLGGVCGRPVCPVDVGVHRNFGAAEISKISSGGTPFAKIAAVL